MNGFPTKPGEYVKICLSDDCVGGYWAKFVQTRDEEWEFVGYTITVSRHKTINSIGRTLVHKTYIGIPFDSHQTNEDYWQPWYSRNMKGMTELIKQEYDDLREVCRELEAET